MKRSFPVHRVVARPVGLVVLVTAACMLLSGLTSVSFTVWDQRDTLVESVALLLSAPLAAAIGALLLWWGRPVPADYALDRGEASLAVTAIWTLLGAVGGLPLVLGAGTSPVDAIFEAISGFTTTGATIYGDIEHTLGRPLILWRAVMHWLGGMGIVVLFVAIFPNIGVSGKNMFKSEVPAITEEGLRPRIAETSLALWRLYLGITLACIGVYWALGMDLHDAVVHAFGTLSTGGFSSLDASMGGFHNPKIDVAASIFMLASGVNFGLYYALVRTRRVSVLWRSSEFRTYVGLSAGFTLLLTVALLPLHHNVLDSARYAFFRVGTTLTSTGYGIDDHREYPPFAMAIMVVMMFIGACSGSTAGGLKVARVVILLETAITQIRRSIRPAVVRVVRVDGRVVDNAILLEVSAFFFVFMVTLAVCAIAVVLTDGVPVATAFGAVLSALSNMGPAPFYLEVDNYARYTAAAKLVFSFAMIIGRLEFFTVLAILAPEVWKR